MLAIMPLLWIAAAPGCPAASHGDVEVTSHRHVSRDVSLAVEDGAALLTMSDRLRPEEAGAVVSTYYSIDLPTNRAVVVDAWLSSANGTVSSTILGPDAADIEFDAFETALRYGSHPDDEAPKRRGPRQAALLVRHSDGGVSVQVAAPCGLGDVDVHLRVRVASDPQQAQWRFELPNTSDVKVRSVAVPGRLWQRLGDSVVVARTEEEARGRFASVRLLGDLERYALRAELDLPRRLSEERALAFVFVLDRSVSFGPDRFVAAARLVESMLAVAPSGSTYAVVVVERYPSVIVSPGTPAETLAPLRALTANARLANGSDVVAALELAKRVAADAGERDGRVVLVSDLETAAAVHEQQVVLTLGKGGSLTHVVKVTGEGTSWWSRSFAEDGNVIAAGAEASGGVLVEGSLLLEQPDLELASYLVRPTRLERPRIVGARGAEVIVDSDQASTLTASDQRSPWLVVEGAQMQDGSADVLPDHLPEGGGFRVSGVVRPLFPAKELTWHAEGSVWATRVRYSLSEAPATALLLPALAAVNQLSDELDDADVMALSDTSGAVSRVAARLALPSWRPPVRYDLGGFGCSCGGGSFSGRGFSCSTCCMGSGNTIVTVYDRAGEIERWLESSRDDCGASGAAMRIEYRRHEILDVTPEEAFGPVERCYREALWTLRLDETPDVTAAAYFSSGDVVVRLPE